MNQSTKTWKKLLSALFLSTLFFCNISHAQNYGAVYIDKDTGIAGGVLNARTNAEGNRLAKDSCIKKHKGQPSNCVYAGSFYNACTAIYWSPINKKVGWAYDGVNTSRAKSGAYSACVKAGGKECQLRLSFCTDRYL